MRVREHKLKLDVCVCAHDVAVREYACKSEFASKRDLFVCACACARRMWLSVRASVSLRVKESARGSRARECQR